MKPLGIWHTRLLLGLALLGAPIAGGTLLAATDAAIRMPTGFQHGYLVNSLPITKEPNKIGLITGNHLIYLNRIGLARLQRGGATAYPDGTIFVDDVRDLVAEDGFYREGARKFVTAMIKDSKRYGATGGWGFQAWPAGDPTKPIVTDAVKQCFFCHTPNKAQDYVFSTYLQ